MRHTLVLIVFILTSPDTYADSVGYVTPTSVTYTFTADNVLKASGGSVTVSCPADSAATPANLGESYTGGSGASGSSTFTVQRIVDPSNILGTCSSGTCGSYP